MRPLISLIDHATCMNEPCRLHEKIKIKIVPKKSHMYTYIYITYLYIRIVWVCTTIREK